MRAKSIEQALILRTLLVDNDIDFQYLLMQKA